MTRMTGPDCTVMCNLINTHTRTHSRTHKNRQRHKHTRVERKKNMYRRTVPAAFSCLPLAMLMCGVFGGDMLALIKELAIRRVVYRSELHSNVSQYLAERMEAACP